MFNLLYFSLGLFLFLKEFLMDFPFFLELFFNFLCPFTLFFFYLFDLKLRLLFVQPFEPFLFFLFHEEPVLLPLPTLFNNFEHKLFVFLFGEDEFFGIVVLLLLIVLGTDPRYIHGKVDFSLGMARLPLGTRYLAVQKGQLVYDL